MVELVGSVEMVELVVGGSEKMLKLVRLEVVAKEARVVVVCLLKLRRLLKMLKLLTVVEVEKSLKQRLPFVAVPVAWVVSAELKLNFRLVVDLVVDSVIGCFLT